ncbi:TetR/AcrR family transcriptional regulator [Acidicapsa dinghuensis]|uniref:TetR/AcrR family transcriptional regulator n=1 Tax=Acidicapsa dinghuensis TaxID=2218256 RepID=A0ABW1EHN5_9BACT|nr:TetR/AcrR family transcriptional regulator [Acidicapsa dinghuensis]
MLGAGAADFAGDVRMETSDKREAILEAMLDLIVERGFHDAPMSVLAKRSGASAGVIYHYFPSKDELIRAVYERVKAVKHEVLLKGYSQDMKPREAFLQLAQNSYRFYRMHRREVRFMDQYVNSPFCGDGTAWMEDPNAAKVLWWFRPKKKGGVLKDLPQEAIDALTQGLVQSLAKADKGFSAETVRRVAETVWEAIAVG